MPGVKYGHMTKLHTAPTGHSSAFRAARPGGEAGYQTLWPLCTCFVAYRQGREWATVTGKHSYTPRHLAPSRAGQGFWYVCAVLLSTISMIVQQASALMPQNSLPADGWGGTGPQGVSKRAVRVLALDRQHPEPNGEGMRKTKSTKMEHTPPRCTTAARAGRRGACPAVRAIQNEELTLASGGLSLLPARVAVILLAEQHLAGQSARAGREQAGQARKMDSTPTVESALA
ncbi:hypothetical protein DACRYDRAFT_107436 [Dacryopinax primogenitus]|uniref:Uncharacterized protein n=1 Tax=Dacryopinax primogenitus (strain DJM 731) TaxID=1858805 RepID=M5GCD6_DACPD|nr:uncharacterized protein DACRYDRAFT_107436 [Dacryopinax primogenitus]EJU01688.1 hypothetical protein DACRYDRAFT_107436 [Dacryopinax primogenitus]